MPTIGVIRGVGEGFVATGFIIKLIKAINRRFRSKIQIIELNTEALADDEEAGSKIREFINSCDCVYVGDTNYAAFPSSFNENDVAMILSCNLRYKRVSGLDKLGSINVSLASYFDGGSRFRDGNNNPDGCYETRICSTFSAKSIAKRVCRHCEGRGRRIAFVKDSDNEYSSELFYKKFIDYTFPLNNFTIFKYSVSDITSELMHDLCRFDAIFGSETFCEFADGIFKFKMKDFYTSYYMFDGEKSVFAVNGLYDNSPSSDFVPSICSYIVALCDLLKGAFEMEKEGTYLRLALEESFRNNKSNCYDGKFIDSVIENLNNPVKTKFVKNTKKRYIIK